MRKIKRLPNASKNRRSLKPAGIGHRPRSWRHPSSPCDARQRLPIQLIEKRSTGRRVRGNRALVRSEIIRIPYSRTFGLASAPVPCYPDLDTGRLTAKSHAICTKNFFPVQMRSARSIYPDPPPPLPLTLCTIPELLCPIPAKPCEPTLGALSANDVFSVSAGGPRLSIEYSSDCAIALWN